MLNSFLINSLMTCLCRMYFHGMAVVFLSYHWTLIALHSVMKICLIISSVIIKNIKISWLRLFLIEVVVIISRLFLNLLRLLEMKTKYKCKKTTFMYKYDNKIFS